jgi:hypothetical protein
MKSQTWQFLKLFLIVLISLHILLGAVLLGSWMTGREHASGSAPPSAAGGG